MTTEKMTVHQALCELKVLGNRIDKAVRDTIPVAVKEHGSDKVNASAISDFKKLAQSSHDSASDLIRRKMAIKAAINKYNASKIITVAGKQYSVAEAIWLMQQGLDDKKDMLRRYTTILDKALSDIEKKNGEDLNRRAENAMNAIYGGKEKADPEEYLNALSGYKEKHALELVDPLDIRKVIADLDAEISAFEVGVDAAIQVANATTEIEIEY